MSKPSIDLAVVEHDSEIHEGERLACIADSPVESRLEPVVWDVVPAGIHSLLHAGHGQLN